ncbi:MAG: D-alanyl-D-alanine carboxypeptidase, partial [Ktedonobacteraceae bacterium]|nr:D-alanyl-D-alanine carboxypeptidase [Ktedonobacteraceae bacterium]
MHTPPPQDDETIDQTSGPYFHRAGPRYRPARSYSSSRSYHSDEHPEVPRVKRASLGFDETDLSTSLTRNGAQRANATSRLSSTEKVERVKRPLRRPSSPSARGSRLAPPARTRNKRVEQPARRPYSYEKILHSRVYEEDFLDALEEDSGQTDAAPRATTKIMVAQRRRSTISTVYEPPTGPSAYRSKERRTKQGNTFLSYLQQIGHNRKLMVAISIIVVILLVLPMVVNAIENNTHSMTLLSPGSGSAISSNASGAAQSVSGGSSSHRLVIIPSDTNHPAPPIFAASAYLLDADTGATLYAHNPFLHLPMLSTTKLMTALLAAEKGNPDQKITINGQVSNDINQLAAASSVMGIKRGETYTLHDLLYGMFLMSGNDAATAVADAIGGNLPAFVGMMNRRASQLGLYDTHYMNPHGLLADGHYSSAHDLALLGKVVMSIPLLHQISGTRQYTLPKTSEHAEHIMYNGNQFL